MATVRIYKVAELLGTTSQEVLALLRRDHGIELKSASSTIEEVVARSFVERLARQRNISLPGGDMFAEHAPPAKAATKKAAAPKKAEPPKPAAPVLGPPRLVKTIRPQAPPAETAVAASAAPPAGSEPEVMDTPHPAVATAQVVGVPDARLGEVGAAFVTLKADTAASEAELTAFVRARCANFRVPRYLAVVASFDAIGMTASGKVQKHALREHAIRTFRLDARRVEAEATR